MDYDISGASYVHGLTTFSVDVLLDALHVNGWRLEDVLCIDMPVLLLREMQGHRLMEMGPDPFVSVNNPKRVPTIAGIPIRTVKSDRRTPCYDVIVRPRHDTALHEFKIITREI